MANEISFLLCFFLITTTMLVDFHGVSGEICFGTNEKEENNTLAYSYVLEDQFNGFLEEHKFSSNRKVISMGADLAGLYGYIAGTPVSFGIGSTTTKTTESTSTVDPAYLLNKTCTGEARFVAYSNDADTPGLVLGKTPIFTIKCSGVSVSDFEEPVTVVSNEKYWFGLIVNFTKNVQFNPSAFAIHGVGNRTGKVWFFGFDINNPVNNLTQIPDNPIGFGSVSDTQPTVWAVCSSPTSPPVQNGGQRVSEKWLVAFWLSLGFVLLCLFFCIIVGSLILGEA